MFSGCHVHGNDILMPLGLDGIPHAHSRSCGEFDANTSNHNEGSRGPAMANDDSTSGMLSYNITIKRGTNNRR
jgi:hypothetical protein